MNKLEEMERKRFEARLVRTMKTGYFWRNATDEEKANAFLKLTEENFSNGELLNLYRAMFLAAEDELNEIESIVSASLSEMDSQSTGKQQLIVWLDARRLEREEHPRRKADES